MKTSLFCEVLPLREGQASGAHLLQMWTIEEETAAKRRDQRAGEESAQTQTRVDALGWRPMG